jgi:hypothetical protein
VANVQHSATARSGCQSTPGPSHTDVITDHPVEFDAKARIDVSAAAEMLTCQPSRVAAASCGIHIPSGGHARTRARYNCRPQRSALAPGPRTNPPVPANGLQEREAPTQRLGLHRRERQRRPPHLCIAHCCPDLRRLHNPTQRPSEGQPNWQDTRPGLSRGHRDADS